MATGIVQAIVDRQKWLDDLSDAVQPLVSSAFSSGGEAGHVVKDLLNGVWLGHPLHPVINDPVYGYQAINVEAQLRTQTSLLNWMKRMIRVRKQYPVFGRGDITFLNPANQKVLAYVRHYEGQRVLVVNNLSRFPPIGDLPYFITLGPHGFYWFRLESSEG